MVRQILLMLAASLSFAVMGLLVRLSAQSDIVWKVFFRNFVVLVLILASMKPSQWSKLIGKKENRIKLLIRGISGTLGVAGYFIGLEYLPLANASILNRLNPFFVSILGIFLLRQRINLVQALALVLAFIGAIFVIEPGNDFPLWPTAAALSSALFAGLAYTVIRSIGTNEDSRSIMAYFAVISLVSTLPVVVFTHASLALSELPLLLAIGVFAGLGQSLLTLSYRQGHAATISAFGYSNVVFSAVLGFVFYDERGSLWFYLGALLILGSLIMLYRQNGRKAEQS